MKKLTVLLMCVCCVFTAQAQKQFTLNMGHRTKRILRIERKEYQTY